MTDSTTPTTPTPDKTPVSPWSYAGAKKAYHAGIAGAVTAAGTVSLAGIFADGKVDGAEAATLVGTVVGGFVVAFFAAWVSENKPSS